MLKSYFDAKQESNPKGAIKLIQLFFVRGLQPRYIRNLMDRDKDIRSFSYLEARFDVVMTKIRQAHIDNPAKLLNNNNAHNNYNSPTRPPASLRRVNMLMVKRIINLSVDPLSISQALRHPYANQFMAAFADKISLLKYLKSFVAYLGHPKDIPKGTLLSSEAIFTMVYVKKFKARLVASGDILKNILDSDTYAGTV